MCTSKKKIQITPRNHAGQVYYHVKCFQCVFDSALRKTQAPHTAHSPPLWSKGFVYCHSSKITSYVWRYLIPWI